MTIKELLARKLSPEELALLPTSFDIMGNKEKAVAVIDIPKELEKKEDVIAKAIMKKHRNVRSVLKKASPIKGIYRTRDYVLVRGSKKTEVVHAENDCRFLLDPQTVYFSPRESTERLRMTEKVREGDVVMVFFAGVGPFPIVIEKKSKPSRIIAVEINPVAVEYFWKNIKLNKSQKIEVLLGDVTGNVEQFYGQCDRVLMPLPEKSVEYLPDAIKCLKPGGVCYFYCFSGDDLDEKKEKILYIAKSIKKKIRFIGVQRVLPYGPRVHKYRIDFELIQ
ncbi:MAG: tRNA (guanine-N1)-methyltransferase [Candidatus Aenigmarchaeota archaeon]|nr:tRNA (guanine-N1)-methyltransferase [Candidatus Aenigmarchaeota archaeon]